MPFRFSLEQVLEVRIREREAAQRRLGEALRVLEAIERRIGEYRSGLARAAEERRRQGRVFDVRRLELHDAYARDTRRRIEESEREAEEARAVVEERRAELVETERRCEALEELKKAEWSEHRREELLDERKRNDDLAVFAFGRRRTENNSPR